MGYCEPPQCISSNIFYILVKYHCHMKQLLKLTCVLNACLKQMFPFLSLPSTTRFAEPSAGAGLHHFLQSSSSS